MYIVKVMKRKDASSVVVAILLAMMLSQLLMFVTGELSAKISGLNNEDGGFYYGAGGDWKVTYLQPFVSVLLQLLALEVLLRLVVWLRPMFVRKQR